MPIKLETKTGGTMAGTTTVLNVKTEPEEGPRTVYSNEWTVSKKPKTQERKP